MASAKHSADLQQALAKVLRSIADQVERLTDEQMRAVASGEAGVTLVVANVKSERDAEGTTPGSASKSEVDFPEIAARLRACETRDAGLALLAEVFATKRDLERFTRYLDVSVQRNDTVDALRDKVVSTTIGFRLRSAAIRGEP